MGKLLFKLLYPVGILVAAYILPGVMVTSFWSAIAVAVVLSILNVLVKPVLTILTIPITIVTLGLFLLVINAIIVLMADFFLSGFSVDGFWWALIFSVVLYFIYSFINEFKPKKSY